MEQFKTVKQSAESFKISELGVWKLIRQKKVPTKIVYGKVMVNFDKLQNFFRKNKANLTLLQMIPE